MAGSPSWKVYSPEDEYIASFKYPEDAAQFVSGRADGTTIRHGHGKAWTVWEEGSRRYPESDSFDRTASIMRERLATLQKSAYDKVYKP